VYFGLDRFNARMRARNFTVGDLPELMAYLHRRGVKGYVTLNTLVFPEEVEGVVEFGRAIIGAGVDAAIVQDVGLCWLLRRLSSDFPLHASTQMTVTSARGAAFAAGLGCEVVVLARELPVGEIGKVGSGVAGMVSEVPALEVFVHGALCVAYSGQCLTSESLGGRSANRGVCAQACRLPYELISDGQKVDLGDRRYLLSPQDLAGLEMVPELVKAGVKSLKIEGRLKSPEYVANIVRVYREALDRLAVAGGEMEGGRREVGEVMRGRRYELEMAFSRGLYPGWLGGVNNQELVHAQFGKKRGVYLGLVTAVRGGGVEVELAGSVKPGDGVVFDAGRPDLNEEGGRVFEVEERGGTVVLRFGRGRLDVARVKRGDRVWKTSDPALEGRLRGTYEGDRIRFTRPVDVEVLGRAGEPLVVRLSDRCGNVVRVESAQALAVAEKRPLTEEKLREQLGRLGGTPFHLEGLSCELGGELMLPVSELNEMRRRAVLELVELRERARRWELVEGVELGGEMPDEVRGLGAGEAVLSVLVRSLEQLDAVLSDGVGIVYCDFEDPRKYKEAVKRYRDSGVQGEVDGAGIFLAPPRIFKMGEEGVLRLVGSAGADGVLARNVDHLEFFRGVRMVGDFSLNVANCWAAEVYWEKYELERLTASYDLDHVQLGALLGSVPAGRMEVTLHQHMPMFHMEHCVFCAFLSEGTDHTNCGRPCDRHALRLKDRVGVEHPVKADVGCRNTVFNGVAQTGAEHVGGLLAAGGRHFRLEFVEESAVEVRRTVGRYRALFRGEVTGGELWRELKLLSHLGVTRGPMG
jgi:putative protease